MSGGDFSDVFTLSGARPPIAPAIGAGAAPAPLFGGITKPSIDMQAVRDGRRSTPLQYIVDLSSARSFAAGTALLLDIQGNVFHSDPLFDLSGNSQAGVARVHFQDENLNPVGTYVTVLPSAIYKIPFTRVAIENYAQPGKFLSIVYGMDIDLAPGASQQVQASIINLAQQSIGGVNSLVVTERGFVAGARAYASTLLAANTSEQVFAPGANVNGAIVWRATGVTNNGSGVPQYALQAHTSAPNGFAVGTVLSGVCDLNITAIPSYTATVKVFEPQLVAAGLGVYWTAGVLETVGLRNVHYSLL